jgi:hypothetical protein
MASASLRLDVALAPCRSTLLGSLRACLAAAGDTRDAAAVAGLTGLAFHLNVDPVVSPAGVAAYPWPQELPAMAARLGHELALVHADDEDPRFERAQAAAAAQAIDGLRRGVPSILWGVHLPEFGLIRGADPARGELAVSGVLDDRGGAPALAIDRLGRGDVPVLLVATLAPGGEGAAPAAGAAELAALRHAVRHARDLGPRLGGFSCGLAAYDAWLAALDSGRIDPAGHAYTLHVTAELRAAAAPFLRRAAGALAGGAAEALRHAAAAYQRVADRLIALSGDTPWPLPEAFALTTSAREAALAALGAAAAAEADGVAALEQTLDAARRERATAGVRIADATPADADALFRCVRDLPIAELVVTAEAERARVAGRLGGALRAKLARCGDEVVGHLYYAALEQAAAPVELAEPGGRYLYLYCPWVARERRSSGIGAALVASLIDTARAEGVAGVLAEATGQEVFLHEAAFAALGFEPLDRAGEDSVLMYLPITGPRPAARLAPVAPPPETAGGRARLPVVVAQWRPCPLLAATRDNVVAGAARAQERGAALDLELRRAPPDEITVGDRRLPLGYIPAPAAEIALLDAANAWGERRR